MLSELLFHVIKYLPKTHVFFCKKYVYLPLEASAPKAV